MKQWFQLGAVALALAAVSVAQADTLKKIKDSGSVTMGVRESSGALSYTLGDGKYTGYHVEICDAVLKTLRKQIGPVRFFCGAATSR